MPTVVVVRLPSKPFDEEVIHAVEKGLNLLDFEPNYETVLIKPNLCSEKIAMITDRRIIYALARYFKNRNCNIIIGENPVINTPSKKLFSSPEIEILRRKTGVEVVNLRFKKFKKVKVLNPILFREIELSEYAVTADAIINVPIMRRHALAGLTLGIKNLFGLVSLRQRYFMHSEGLYKGLIDIAKVLRDKLKLTVIDGIKATIDGGLIPIGMIVMGRDIVATDTIVSYLLGWDPQELELLKYAQEEGIGISNLDQIEVIGITWSEIEALRKGLRKWFRPPMRSIEELVRELGKIEVVLGEACPSCIRSLSVVLSAFSPKDFENSPELAILVGPKAEPVKNKLNIVIGNCLKKYRECGIFVGCCPVYTHDIRVALEYAIGKVKKPIYLWDSLKKFIHSPI
ncbi:MAG: hypothetical protein DRJ49_04725 [Thermoprotei archaeon]|nr:MAG: hypothetical protein DRJ49_04725 [Thermoprotei archaeon]